MLIIKIVIVFIYLILTLNLVDKTSWRKHEKSWTKYGRLRSSTRKKTHTGICRLLSSTWRIEIIKQTTALWKTSFIYQFDPEIWIILFPSSLYWILIAKTHLIIKLLWLKYQFKTKIGRPDKLTSQIKSLTKYGS